MSRTKHQIIANRIAEIADQHSRIRHAQEYDVPEDLEAALTASREAAEAAGAEGSYASETRARTRFAAEYLERELAKLKVEASDLDIFLDPALLEALIPSIEDTTKWSSSSYGC